MATQMQSENKSLKKAKIAMTLATVILIVLLFTVPLWKSNVAQTGTFSKIVGVIAFLISFGCIAVESWVRNRFSETAFYFGWFISVALGLVLLMNGGF